MIDQAIKTRAKIFACLEAGHLHIQVAYGYGMNDGGALRSVPLAAVPEDCRMPNTYVWVLLQHGEIIEVFKMTAAEVAENEWP